VVAEQHFHVRHLHYLHKYFGAVFVAVNDISLNIESVRFLEIDLLHYGIEAVKVSVDV
jgi:hypothetical protein